MKQEYKLTACLSLLLAMSITIALCNQPTSQQANKELCVSVPTVKKAPKMNGLVDEKEWDNAAVLKNFRVLGHPNKMADPKTVVKIMRKDDTIYILAELFEPKISKIQASVKAEQLHDKHLMFQSDDLFEVFIIPDEGWACQFAVNPANARISNSVKPFDIFYKDWRQPTIKTKWRPRWNSAVMVYKNKWVVEMAIYISEFPKTKKWKFNVCRERRPDGGELSTWSPMTGMSFLHPNQYGYIEFDKDASNAGN